MLLALLFVLFNFPDKTKPDFGWFGNGYRTAGTRATKGRLRMVRLGKRKTVATAAGVGFVAVTRAALTIRCVRRFGGGIVRTPDCVAS
jgi:hypothetical protein